MNFAVLLHQSIMPNLKTHFRNTNCCGKQSFCYFIVHCWHPSTLLWLRPLLWTQLTIYTASPIGYLPATPTLNVTKLEHMIFFPKCDHYPALSNSVTNTIIVFVVQDPAYLRVSEAWESCFTFPLFCFHLICGPYHFSS